MTVRSFGSKSLIAVISTALLMAASPQAAVQAIGDETGDMPGVDSPAPVNQEENWEVRETQIDINGQTFRLILRHFPGDVAWADRVQAFIPGAVPALQQAIGAPYPGPPALRITERTGQEMYGAAGIAGCNESMCGLAIGEETDKVVLLHEIAHVWTYEFKNRWLAEGTAQFAAIGAAGVLGIPVDYPPDARTFLPSRPLNHWGSPVNFLTADDETLFLEYEGYDRATRLLQLIQSRNAGALAAAYTALVEGQQWSIESEQFMDAVEDAGGGNNDDLFGAWVFGSDMAAALVERRMARDGFAGVANRLATEAPELGQDGLTPARQLIGDWKFAEANAALAAANGGIDAYLQIRDRLAAFRAAANAVGLAYPAPFDQAKTTLDFAPITSQLDKGDQAIAAYPAARDSVHAPRSGLQKIGLLGQDPDGLLKDAAGAFAWGGFDESIEKGRRAQEAISGAQSAGYRNAAIAVALVAALVIAGFFAVRWALSAEAQPTPAEG